MRRTAWSFNKIPWLSYAVIAMLAAADALVTIAFIYPNDFAPVGIIGFSTMIQHVFGISVGYLYILVNAPLLVLAFFVLNRRYSLKNLCYIVFFSAATVIFQQAIRLFDLSWIEYRAATSEAAIIVAMGYGMFMGAVYASAVALGGSTGGTDILAATINRARPAFNTVWILFGINAVVAVMSYFVYGRRTLPVILSVLCSLVTGYVSDRLLKGASSALKFEIITERPEELAGDIMNILERGCTRLPSVGMYSGKQSAVLVCIVNKRQRFEMERIISKYQGSFGYCSPVSSTYGYFNK